jgi:hypothetical protein
VGVLLASRNLTMDELNASIEHLSEHELVSVDRLSLADPFGWPACAAHGFGLCLWCGYAYRCRCWMRCGNAGVLPCIRKHGGYLSREDLITRYAHASRVLVTVRDVSSVGSTLRMWAPQGALPGPVCISRFALVAGIAQDPQRFLAAGRVTGASMGSVEG